MTASMFRKAVLRRVSRFSVGEMRIAEGGETRRFGPGGGPSASVTVNDPRFWRRAALGGSVGAGEAYMEGWWTSEDLVETIRLFARNIPASRAIERGAAMLFVPVRRLVHLLRKNTRAGSRKNIEAHYDLGNEFFRLFLDDTLTYSCGIFTSPDSTLREASVAKLDRICRKLRLEPAHHVMEIGSGWGSFALHAAGEYGCRVTTATISKKQHALATDRVREAGLTDRVKVLLRDYRDIEGTFDRLVSIEMIEAVGHRFLAEFFGKCSGLLREDGLMALQAIVMPDQDYAMYLRSVDFIQRHVFPGGGLPSRSSMLDAAARATDLQLVHLEDLTPHYARTLRHWRERFAERIDEVRSLGYPERFVRLWEFYLSYCEAGFLERYVGDLQLLFAKPEYRGETLPPALPEAGVAA